MMTAEEREQLERVHVFYGAVCTLLMQSSMTAEAIGVVLYRGDPAATSRARGGLLAMRSLGWVDSYVDDERARWWT